MNKFDIQRFRALNKISQAELAEYLQINSSYLSQVETGRRPLSEKLLRKIIENKRGWIVDKPNDYKETTLIETRVLDTIISQQETIASLTKLLAIAKEKTMIAPAEDNAECADAAGA